MQDRATLVSEEMKVILSGLSAGVFCATVFHPWDRALYLSQLHQRPFLSAANFHSPYHGVLQTLIHRSLFGGAYYAIQSEAKASIYPYLRHTLKMNESASQFGVGVFAGGLYGILSNFMYAIKYYTWKVEGRTFSSSAREMWLQGGIKSFTKGTQAGLTRDITFGSTYEVLRNLLLSKFVIDETHHHSVFVCNTVAALCASIASGPFNYVRNTQYGVNPGTRLPTATEILSSLWRDSRTHPTSSYNQLRFFQQQLNIGWGTARVAVSMAVGQRVFEYTKSMLK